MDPGGIEIFTSDLNSFRAALMLENRTLKRALTDPRLLSGIGNAYSDEILHAAQLSPIALTHKLRPHEWERLFAAARQTLELWVDRLRAEAEADFPEKVTAFRKEMAVHGRYGEPCSRCGEKIQRIRYADNETNYCARCQTGGKVLADRSLSRLLRSDWPRTLEELEGLQAPVKRAGKTVTPECLDCGRLSLHRESPDGGRRKIQPDAAEPLGFEPEPAARDRTAGEIGVLNKLAFVRERVHHGAYVPDSIYAGKVAKRQARYNCIDAFEDSSERIRLKCRASPQRTRTAGKFVAEEGRKGRIALNDDQTLRVKFLARSARVTAPVPAPISSTDESAGPTSDAMSCESFGELGASAPIALGLSSKERTKMKGAGDERLMGPTWRITEWLARTRRLQNLY